MALTLEKSSLRLFGLDLTAVPGYLRDGWAEALRWPWLRWLTPENSFRVLHADGTESVRQGVSARRLKSPVRTRFVAVELPEPTLLRRSLSLPRLADEELRQAVELDVHSASPFPGEELAWGCRVERGDRLRVETALTSRSLIEQQINALRPRLGDAQPEVWAGGERPFVIPGYGESARLARVRRMRLALIGLLSVTIVLLAALAVTPTLQLRERALGAISRHDELSQAVKPQVQMRDELVRLGDQIALLAKAAARRPDVVALIDEITRQLPDDATLTRLEFAEGTVRIAGMADNAAQLLQTLGANPGFRDVRAPGGITKAPIGGKEGFVIEFRVGGEVRGQ